ncbi:MAG: hypothetical protein GY708_25090 [Actinomycetia bacterium]|nr:hypothetical protein [Actinomycetes bacterium]MCP4961211.1 hypothetical protein [Actinomycetes bacterium]
MATLSRVVVVVSIAFSVTVLFLTLSKAKRESRIRHWIEYARVAVGLGGAVLLGVIVGVQTPLVLAVAAVVVGIAIGYFQGQQTTVSIRESKLWAKRTMWGIAVWAAGLVAMQVAGLGSRTGIFRLGQAISMFSISVGLGLIVGRRPIEQRATAENTVAEVHP